VRFADIGQLQFLHMFVLHLRWPSFSMLLTTSRLHHPSILSTQLPVFFTQYRYYYGSIISKFVLRLYDS